jgi:capsular polysaccharide transport system permease protein
MRAIIALMLREMATTYGRSPGGYVWAVLEPAAGIGVLTAIFSFALVSPPIGTNFPLFYATGIVPFLAYLDVSNKVAQSMQFSKALLTYPRVTFIDAILARFLLNMLTQILVTYLIFLGLFIFIEHTSEVKFTNVALAMAMIGSLSLGIGTLNCFLTMQFPVWIRIWGIIMRPMFILSCIFFIFDIIPQPYRDYLWYNPLVHIVGRMRSGFYDTYEALYVSEAYVFGISIVLVFFGVALLGRFHRDLLNN